MLIESSPSATTAVIMHVTMFLISPIFIIPPSYWICSSARSNDERPTSQMRQWRACVLARFLNSGSDCLQLSAVNRVTLKQVHHHVEADLGLFSVTYVDSV